MPIYFLVFVGNLGSLRSYTRVSHFFIFVLFYFLFKYANNVLYYNVIEIFFYIYKSQKRMYREKKEQIWVKCQKFITTHMSCVNNLINSTDIYIYYMKITYLSIYGNLYVTVTSLIF